MKTESQLINQFTEKLAALFQGAKADIEGWRKRIILADGTQLLIEQHGPSWNYNRKFRVEVNVVESYYLSGRNRRNPYVLADQNAIADNVEQAYDKIVATALPKANQMLEEIAKAKECSRKAAEQRENNSARFQQIMADAGYPGVESYKRFNLSCGSCIIQNSGRNLTEINLRVPLDNLKEMLAVLQPLIEKEK